MAGGCRVGQRGRGTFPGLGRSVRGPGAALQGDVCGPDGSLPAVATQGGWKGSPRGLPHPAWGTPSSRSPVASVQFPPRISPKPWKSLVSRRGHQIPDEGTGEPAWGRGCPWESPRMRFFLIGGGGDGRLPVPQPLLEKDAGLERGSFCRAGGCPSPLRGESARGAQKPLPAAPLDGPPRATLPGARTAAQLNVQPGDTGKELTFYVLTPERGRGEEVRWGQCWPAGAPGVIRRRTRPPVCPSQGPEGWAGPPRSRTRRGRIATCRRGNTPVAKSSPGRTLPASLTYLVAFSMVANNNLVRKHETKKRRIRLPRRRPRTA